jgi:hypothetical protein
VDFFAELCSTGESEIKLSRYRKKGNRKKPSQKPKQKFF